MKYIRIYNIGLHPAQKISEFFEILEPRNVVNLGDDDAEHGNFHVLRVRWNCDTSHALVEGDYDCYDFVYYHGTFQLVRGSYHKMN